MTGFLLCQKYAVLNEILHRGESETTPMCFIDFDDMLMNIMDQWPDIGYQSDTNKSKVVSGVVQYVLEIISHYRQYFRDIPIVFYHTDITSQSDQFQTGQESQTSYRLNYLTRFQSVKFRNFGKLYAESLFDVLRMVIDSVIGAHIVRVSNMDASLMPLIFAKTYPDRPIYVISWDNVDTLLSYYADNITVVYDARQVKYGVNPTVVQGRSYIDTVTNAINPNHYGRFATHVLISAVGNEKRSLYGIGKRPAGYDVVAQWLQQVFGNDPIPLEYMDIHPISAQIRDSETRKDFEESYRGSDLELQYQMIPEDTKIGILYNLDHEPIDPQEIRKLFPNIIVDWERVYG